LLLCSVGIALALLGTFLLALSQLGTAAGAPLLDVREILAAPPRVEPLWFKTAVIFLVVGYGTKMGLAPMHTWLPDAHGEAPSPISALLSGALLPCAFLAILRIFHICNAAGDAQFSREILMAIGLLSMAIGAVFMTGQRDLNRLLAY